MRKGQAEIRFTTYVSRVSLDSSPSVDVTSGLFVHFYIVNVHFDFIFSKNIYKESDLRTKKALKCKCTGIILHLINRKGDQLITYTNHLHCFINLSIRNGWKSS